MGFDIIAGPASNPEMAVRLERAGASIVAIMPASLPRFGASQPVDLPTAQVIGESIGTAMLSLILDGRQEIAHVDDCLAQLNPEYVALDMRKSEARRLLPLVRRTRADLILFGIALDYDEDPAWIADRLQALMLEWSPKTIALTLLPGLKSPIDWLRSAAGRHEEDVSIADIEELLARFPISINMELTEADVAWASGRFAKAQGFALFAGESLADGGCPVLEDAESLVRLVEASAMKPL